MDLILVLICSLFLICAYSSAKQRSLKVIHFCLSYRSSLLAQYVGKLHIKHMSRYRFGLQCGCKSKLYYLKRSGLRLVVSAALYPYMLLAVHYDRTHRSLFHSSLVLFLFRYSGESTIDHSWWICHPLHLHHGIYDCWIKSESCLSMLGEPSYLAQKDFPFEISLRVFYLTPFATNYTHSLTSRVF